MLPPSSFTIILNLDRQIFKAAAVAIIAALVEISLWTCVQVM
jgi:hypothetical protein